MNLLRTWLAAGALALLAGCGDGSSPQSASSPPAADSNVVAASSEPDHLWSVHQGDEYGYEAGISDNDQKAGKVASEVIMFRYEGIKNGQYVLISADAPITLARCPKPCQVIEIVDGFGNRQHFSFNPSSVIGEAFTDAMDGKLDVYGASQADAVPAPAAAAPAATPVANPAPASGDAPAAVPADSPPAPPAAPNEQATTDRPAYEPSWQPPPGSPAYRPTPYQRPPGYRPYQPSRAVPY